MDCPTKEQLAECLLGRLTDAEAERFLQHAEQCTTCSQILDGLDNTSDRVTAALRRNNTSWESSDACERMIDRASAYVQPPPDETAADVRQHLLQGTQVRDYEIIRPLGEGGMGAVFLARHRRLDREVALKVLSLRRAGDVEAQKRFEQEMTIVGKLQHPGIVRALDAGEQDGVQYLVMEVVEGVDLRQLVESLGPVPLAEACEICRQTAAALDYAHEQQLIHRDVKPSNIMLDRHGDAKLMDLGLARFLDQHRSLTSTQQAMGSLDFMAPEQLRAHDVDRRADIYGLASTLHYLLTGEPPEKRRSAALLVARTPKLETLRPTLPPPLLRLLLRMLAADPTKRIDSAKTVVEEIAPYCHRANLPQLAASAGSPRAKGGAESGSTTSEITVKPGAKSWFIRHRIWLLGTLAVLLVVAATLLWMRDNTKPTNFIVLSQLPSVSSHSQPNREIPMFQVHQRAIRCVALAEQTSHLICGSEDATISIRDLPHQRKITVLCQFEGPIRQIALTPDQERFACVDDTGTITLVAVEVPPEAGHLVGKLSPQTFASKPIDLLFSVNPAHLLIRHEDGTLRLYQPETRTTLAEVSISEGVRHMHKSIDADELILTFEDGTSAAWSIPDLKPHDAPPRSGLQAGRQVNGKPISLLANIESKTLAVDGRLARLIDMKNLESEHFIYAEHQHPITVLFPFPDESLVLTGDDSGEIRLWHAPGQAYSDMLMECELDVDAVKMTFDIHRKKKWSLVEFENPDPSAVTYAEAAGVMSITTSIRRDGRDHVLEYKVDPMRERNE